MRRRAFPMSRHRPMLARSAALVVVSFLAATAVPRDAWYAHRHAADGHGHVHGWDGTRIGATTAAVGDLLADHDHTHEHRHDHGHSHQPPAQTAAASPRAHAAHGAELAGVRGALHGHWQAPFQSAAQTSTPALVAHELRLFPALSIVVGSAHEPSRTLRARSPPPLSV